MKKIFLICLILMLNGCYATTGSYGYGVNVSGAYSPGYYQQPYYSNHYNRQPYYTNQYYRQPYYNGYRPYNRGNWGGGHGYRHYGGGWGHHHGR